MIKFKKAIICYLLSLLIFPLIVKSQQTWDWQTSTNWHYKIYNEYMIRNNIWGATAWTGTGVGSQTIYANSERDWKILATHTNGTGNATGQVKAYPQMVRGWVQGGIGKTYPDGTPSPFVSSTHGLNQKINDLTVFNLYHKLELPRKGRYMVLCDMYFYETETPKLPYESNKPDMCVMLFTNFWDDTGWLYGSQDQKITIGYTDWRYKKSTGSSIVRPGGVVFLLSPYVAGNPIDPEGFMNEDILIDFKEILHYLRDNMGLNGNLRVSTIQMGIEIIDGGAFFIHDFQADISDKPIDYIEVTGVSVSPESISLPMGQTSQLTATIEPEDAYYQQVNWSSEDETIAIVDKNGMVTGVGEGVVTITATTVAGNFQASSMVTVEYAEVPVSGVSLSRSSMSLIVGGQETLTASIDPFNATDQSVTWSSDDETVATVDNNGLVSAISEGSAAISVTTSDGDFSDSCLVNVLSSPGLSEYATMIMLDNPLAYWSLNETEGDLAIDNMGIHHATLINNPTLNVSGVDGGGVRFISGSNSYAEAPSHPDLDITGSLTIEFWVNIEDGWGGSEWEALVGKGDNTYQIRRHSFNNNLQFSVRGGTGGNVDVNTNFQIPNNKWIHVVAVYDAEDEDMRVYFNGQKDQVTSGRSGTVGTNSLGLNMGANNSGTQHRRFLSGKLDEVAIYHYALPEQRIKAHYDALAMILSAKPALPNELYLDAVKIFPNPASGFVTVTVPMEARALQAVIIGVDGRILSKQSLQTGGGTIDLDGIKPGMYFLQLYNENVRHTKKLMIN